MPPQEQVCDAHLHIAFCSLWVIDPADKQVIADARRMTGEPEDSSYIPSDPREFANRIFHTCYMGTENSSVETRRRAKQLADAIGRYVFELFQSANANLNADCSYHIDLNMDTVVTALRNLFAFVTGAKPQFRAHGGSTAENLALQNIQASRL
jgi:NAD+ synthase (glutamine-hydrolysing)